MRAACWKGIGLVLAYLALVAAVAITVALLTK